MDQNNTAKIIDYVFTDVFGIKNPYSPEEFRNKFAADVPSVKELICNLSGKKTWGFVPKSEKVASQDAIAEQFGKDEWMKGKRKLESMDDVLTAWKEINYQTTEKYTNSIDVYESDAIYNSSNIFRSVMIFDSKNV